MFLLWRLLQVQTCPIFSDIPTLSPLKKYQEQLLCVMDSVRDERVNEA